MWILGQMKQLALMYTVMLVGLYYYQESLLFAGAKMEVPIEVCCFLVSPSLIPNMFAVIPPEILGRLPRGEGAAEIVSYKVYVTRSPDHLLCVQE